MIYRKLRIAWSAVCGIACLLLIALWVRSYWWLDIANGRQFSISSLQGCLSFGVRGEKQHVTLLSQNLSELKQAGSLLHSGAKYGFVFFQRPNALYIGFPHWLFALATIGPAAAPWISWRFSLRTMLVATTLVAVALGLIIALSR